MVMQIYALTDPREAPLCPRYVGASVQPTVRLLQHVNHAVRVAELDHAETEKGSWLQDLLRHGLFPGLLILETLGADEPWEARERFWIRQHQTSLTNKAPGGAGAPAGRTLTDEHRAKIAQANSHRGKVLNLAQRVSTANKGRMWSEAERQARAENRKPVSNATKQLLSERAVGRKHTLESRRLMSIVQTGRSVSDDTKALLSASKRGVKQTAEHARKAAEARTGKARSEQTKAKISAALKGKQFTPERLLAITQAQRARRLRESSSNQ